MRARAGQPGMDAAWADGCPLSRFWLLPGPRRWQGLLPQAGVARLVRQPLGKPLTLDGLWRHWLLAQVTEELSAQVTEGFAVPGPVPVS